MKKVVPSKIELDCPVCKNKFWKTSAEYYRRIKVKPNTNFFCSRSCSVIFGNKNFPRGGIKNLGEKKRVLKNDENSPFRYYLKTIRYRASDSCRGNKKINDVSLEYLKETWNSQKGICPFTGWELELPVNSAGFEQKNNIKNASIDRIDNSKGYEKGNIRFISIIANYARNSFSDQQVIDFCKAVAIKHSL